MNKITTVKGNLKHWEMMSLEFLLLLFLIVYI